MNIRLATEHDIATVTAIYDSVHTEEERGAATIGWVRGKYPVAETARTALERGELFVQEEGSCIVGCAILNQTQVDCYADGAWTFLAEPARVMVLHTLVISAAHAGKGYGSAFVSYYEHYAKEHGCTVLRMDTNARNKRARALYQKLGYREAGIVPTVFNGIEGVQLVLLEKQLSAPDYALAARQVKAFAAEDAWYVPLLSNTAALLWELLPDINWAGFYLVREDQLVLGPFQGKPACIHIARGKGVCGTAWEQDAVQLVADVHTFPGHIACDSASNAEVVIPIRQNGKVIGVLDIDSPRFYRFTEADRHGLEQIVRVLENDLEV